MIIRVASEHPKVKKFVEWLNKQGHDASINKYNLSELVGVDDDKRAQEILDGFFRDFQEDTKPKGFDLW